LKIEVVALITINHLHFHLPTLVPLPSIWSVMFFWSGLAKATFWKRFPSCSH